MVHVSVIVGFGVPNVINCVPMLMANPVVKEEHVT